MDIRILKYFLAVAREENITRAAKSLHIAADFKGVSGEIVIGGTATETILKAASAMPARIYLETVEGMS